MQTTPLFTPILPRALPGELSAVPLLPGEGGFSLIELPDAAEPGKETAEEALAEQDPFAALVVAPGPTAPPVPGSDGMPSGDTAPEDSGAARVHAPALPGSPVAETAAQDAPQKPDRVQVAASPPPATAQASRTSGAEHRLRLLSTESESIQPEPAIDPLAEPGAELLPRVSAETPVHDATDPPKAPETTISATHSRDAAAALRAPAELRTSPATTQIVQAALTAPDGTAEILLSPEELGTVRITLQTDADRVTLVVQAERPETLDLLRRHAERLAADMRAAGFAQVDLGFGQRSEGEQGRAPPPPAETFGAVATPEPSPLPAPGQPVQAGLYLRI